MEAENGNEAEMNQSGKEAERDKEETGNTGNEEGREIHAQPHRFQTFPSP